MSCTKNDLSKITASAKKYSEANGLTILVVKRGCRYSWCEPRFMLVNDKEIQRFEPIINTSKLSGPNELTTENSIEYEDI